MKYTLLGKGIKGRLWAVIWVLVNPWTQLHLNSVQVSTIAARTAELRTSRNSTELASAHKVFDVDDMAGRTGPRDN